MAKIWDQVVAFLTTASADIALKILGSLVMLFVGFRAIKWLMRLLDKALEKSKWDQGIQSFFKSVLSITLRGILIISLLIYLGVPATSFIAILTSAGLAVGLALQGSLSNFAGGLMILFFHPFRVGDFIQTNSVGGNVQDISIMYTTLKTLDGKKVVLPNALVSNSVVSDFSWYPTRRVEINISTGFDEEVDVMLSLLRGVAAAEARVLSEPAPLVFLDRIEDGRLFFGLRCWTKNSDWWETTGDLTIRIKERMKSQGIRAQAPRMDLGQG